MIDENLRQEECVAALTFEQAVREYYSLPGNSCGGRLHIVLDDQNVLDADLKFCEAECEKGRDWLGLQIINFLQLWGYVDRLRLLNTVHIKFKLVGFPENWPKEQDGGCSIEERLSCSWLHRSDGPAFSACLITTKDGAQVGADDLADRYNGTTLVVRAPLDERREL